MSISTKPNESLQQIINQIKSHERIVLTTHKNSDGDGVGSAMALFWALKQIGKDVSFIQVDPIPPRYSFLTQSSNAALYTNQQISNKDLLIVLDTNQGSLCDPLYTAFKETRAAVWFIDHHVDQSAKHRDDSLLIDSNASSTGEIVYSIIKELKVELTEAMASAIYTSLTFDTQAFKLLRNSVRSHEIAAELAGKNIRTDYIQRQLFATWTVDKLHFLSELITSAYYSKDQKVAGFKVSQKSLTQYHLTLDDISDLIDIFTLVKSVQFCYGIIEGPEEKHKISLRSIENNLAFLVAEELGGGGHAHSSGAWVQGTADEIESRVQSILQKHKNILN